MAKRLGVWVEKGYWPDAVYVTKGRHTEHLRHMKSKFIQSISFGQTQQFITQNILKATCFDSTESSPGLRFVSLCIIVQLK
jgi:hypothetical protein